MNSSDRLNHSIHPVKAAFHRKLLVAAMAADYSGITEQLLRSS
jgi:hypothetical protein